MNVLHSRRLEDSKPNHCHFTVQEAILENDSLNYKIQTKTRLCSWELCSFLSLKSVFLLHSVNLGWLRYYDSLNTVKEI